MEFLIESNYFSRIKVECDEHGRYVKGGDMIFPMAWDMEKRQDAVLKTYKDPRDSLQAVEQKG